VRTMRRLLSSKKRCHMNRQFTDVSEECTVYISGSKAKAKPRKKQEPTERPAVRTPTPTKLVYLQCSVYINSTGVHTYVLSREGVTTDGVLDWILDLLTTLTSELQAITAPGTISTIQKSPQHPLSLF
jgi:hypothetical protein